MINRNNRFKSVDKSQLKGKKSKKNIFISIGGMLLVASLMTGCGKTQINTTAAEITNDSASIIAMDVTTIDYDAFSDDLTSVDIRGTNLTDVSELSKYDALENITVRDNLITDVSSLGNLPNLVYLDIANNSVSSINLENFQNLRYLYVEGNYNLYTQELLDYCQEHGIKIDIDQKDIDAVNQLREVSQSLDLEGKDDLTKEGIIYDYVINHMEYDEAALKDDDLTAEYNLNALQHGVEGKGVCATYAALFDAMCELNDINCYRISGIANGGPHGWNLVEIDGEYMLCDPTWADTALPFGLFKNFFYNKTGDSAERFIDEHKEVYTGTYMDPSLAEETNVRSDMAVRSDANNLKEDKENIFEHVVSICEDIDYSKIPARQLASALMLGIAGGYVIKLSVRTQKELKEKAAKLRAERKEREEQERREASVRRPVHKEPIVPPDRTVPDAIVTRQEPIKEAPEIEIPKKKELTMEEQIEALATIEEKIALIDELSLQTLREAATEQVNLDIYNHNTDSTFKEEKIQKAMEELLSLCGLSKHQKAIVRNQRENRISADFDLSKATDDERQLHFVTMEYYADIDAIMDRYEWLQTTKQYLQQLGVDDQYDPGDDSSFGL